MFQSKSLHQIVVQKKVTSFSDRDSVSAHSEYDHSKYAYQRTGFFRAFLLESILNLIGFP